MTDIGDNAAGQLRSLIERIEKLAEEKAEVSAQIKEVFGEAKANGFDVPAMREVIKSRAMDANKLAQREAMIDLYMQSLGMLAGTPLGEAGARELRVGP